MVRMNSCLLSLLLCDSSDLACSSAKPLPRALLNGKCLEAFYNSAIIVIIIITIRGSDLIDYLVLVGQRRVLRQWSYKVKG